ncbi:hypothetical protein [Candidatus Amarobacter glycogenicus]|uniref:hypothetical protein n=1 Tax=Candidatus Amarobacter glycogenicus TaxID=3140699 RepID=UPI00313528F7|nr:hypothetical protein [Dehalococcoidia bacterium]
MSTSVVVVIAALAVIGASAAAWWYLRRRRRDGATFEGTFSFGWEVSSFVPGDSSRTSPRYWVAWTPESRLMEKLKEQGYDPAWTAGYGTVRAKLAGTLEKRAEGGYGHMGQYSGQLTVSRVLQMSKYERGG